jgi:hypothetical protein
MKTNLSLQSHCSITRLSINITACLFLIMALVSVQQVSAAPPTIHYYVDTTTDSNAAGYQVCDADLGNNNCSLRGAISKANAYSGGASDYHHIHLQSATYLVTIPGSDENGNTSGDLDTGNHYIIIEGAGPSSTFINADTLGDRVIDDWGTSGLKLVGLTVENGTLASGLGGGGGIRSRFTSSLTLDNVHVDANVVAGTLVGDSGGGIFVQNTHVSITNSTVTNNSACHGGGISVDDSSLNDLHLTNGQLSQNIARCGNGGGLHITDLTNVYLDHWDFGYNDAKQGAGYYDSPGTVLEGGPTLFYENTIIAAGTGAAAMEIFGTASINGAVIFQNAALTGPGGIKLNPGSTLTLTNSYLHHNHGNAAGALLAAGNTSALLQQVAITYNYADNGGGISVTSNGNIDLENVTISHNDADDNGGGLYLAANNSANLNHVTIATNLGDTHGDAVFIGNNGHWSTRNSIFHFNIPGDVCYYEALYIVMSNGHNIINDASCNLNAGTDLPSTDPMLGGLGTYGSDLPTRPLLPGSPAIDGALISDPVTTDQRGWARIDGDQNGFVISDIGAFEYYLLSFLPEIFKP